MRTRNFICIECGTQFQERRDPPPRCPVCEDERQYVRWEGQAWTTLDELRSDHENRFEPEGDGLIGIGTEPSFAIGQRALLVQGRGGNVLWDCVSLVDDETVRRIEERGGLDAVAISHPHYYSSMVEWSRAFGGIPVFIHSADRRWVQRTDRALILWTGERLRISEGMTLVRLGGHFEGGTALHWEDGADGEGALLSGDVVQVVRDRRWVSFMYSYPNLIPLPPARIRGLVGALEPFRFREIYGAWWDHVVRDEGHEVVRRSARRYLAALGAEPDAAPGAEPEGL